MKNKTATLLPVISFFPTVLYGQGDFDNYLNKSAGKFDHCLHEQARIIEIN